MPILNSRLQPPVMRTACLVRPRLHQLLVPSCPLILLVAPAGYGKTLLLTTWLAELGALQAEQHAVATAAKLPGLPPHTAWLTLGPEDNHPERLLRGLVAALQLVEPSVGITTLAALDAAEPPAAAMMLLSNELAATRVPWRMVLDNYHQVQAEAAHRLIEALLVAQLPKLQLVLAARELPPIALVRLRTAGLIAILDTADLRFTPDESAAWLRLQTGWEPDAAELAAIEACTEGWAAALALLGLAMRDQMAPVAVRELLAASDSLTSDYLEEEVLAQLDHATYAFVLHTAILDQFCADLCAAVLESDAPHQCQLQLEQLQRRNLFVAPIPDAPGWFRYHPRFAMALRRRLRRELTATALMRLHERAAAWFAAVGMAPAAISHALASGQSTHAAALIDAQSLSDLLGNIPHATVMGWLAALPEAAVRTYPRLCLLRAWAELERHDRVASATWASYAEAAAHEDSPAATEVAMLGTMAHLFQDEPEQEEQSIAQIMARLPTSSGELAILTHLLIGMAASTEADWAQARASFLTMGRMAHQAASAFLCSVAGIGLICAELAQGELPAAAASCQRLLSQLPEHGPLVELQTLTRLLVMEIEREQGATLDHNGLASLAAARFSDVDVQILANVLLVRAALACADLNLAQQVAEALHRLAAGERRPLVAETAAALCAQVALQRADLNAALGWIATAPVVPPGLKQPLIGSFMWEHCVLAPLHIQLALAMRGGTRAMWATLSEQVATAETDLGMSYGLRVRLRILRALAYDGLAAHRQAQVALLDAFTLAAPYGWLAPFREVGLTLQRMLPSVRAAASPLDQRLLALIAQIELHPPTAQPGLVPGLSERLTKREQEVLALLAGGASNRAIADQLILSEGTVKGYVHTILGKLDARSRTEAIARARDLGLI